MADSTIVDRTSRAVGDTLSWLFLISVALELLRGADGLGVSGADDLGARRRDHDERHLLFARRRLCHAARSSTAPG